MKLTLNQIRSYNPCESSWEILLNSLDKTQADDSTVTLMYILNTLGIEDAIWCLCCFDYLDYCLFLADIAENVLPIFEEKYKSQAPKKAIEAIRLYKEGLISKDDLAAAADDAALATAIVAAPDDAAIDAVAVVAAAYAAANTAYAAANTASADTASADTAVYVTDVAVADTAVYVTDVAVADTAVYVTDVAVAVAAVADAVAIAAVAAVAAVATTLADAIALADAAADAARKKKWKEIESLFIKHFDIIEIDEN